MNTPLVSWLMPIYNSECFLPRAMESMLLQTYTHFEVVLIIENGCADDTLDICEQYARKDKRIRIFVNKSKLGLPESLNRGVYLCQGKYIARMDVDDVSFKDRLEKQVRFMEENLDVDILGSQVRVVNVHPESEQITEWLDNESIKARLLFSCCICHPSVMIRREMLVQNTLRYPDCYAEDYALWVSLLTKSKFSIYPEPLIEYHLHGGNGCTVLFEDVRKSMAKTSRRAISTELGLELSGFPDCLFGWRKKIQPLMIYAAFYRVARNYFK